MSCDDVLKPLHEMLGTIESLLGREDATAAVKESLALAFGQGRRVREAIERATRRAEVLEETDRRKNEFLAMLSHELRNPLAPIASSLALLDRFACDEEHVQRALGVIQRQVRHLTRIVDDLLDVSRITQGRMQLARERLDLGELVRGVAMDHLATFAENGVALDVQLPAEPVTVEGDPTRLAQVIGNLLANAVKFTPRGGHTWVGLEAEGRERVRLRVRDDGAGLPPEMLGRVFQPFVQADSTRGQSRGGLGLGLAMVKGLVELHGGTVAAHSDGAGRGAEITVRLPRSGPARPRAAAVSPPAARARRVLIVEDNLDSAESLKAVLQLEGHEVEVALNGPEGIEKSRAFHPEIVLCDIGLPGMDGYEVARAMRADAELRDVHLVALSGWTQPADQRRAEEAGFERHVAKPPGLETLEQVLTSLGPVPRQHR